MKGNQADHPIAAMCRVLGVSPSGYYAWQHRAPSARTQRDAKLTMTIHTIHLESRGTYGAPQYTAIAYGQRCLAFGVRPSMGSVGDAYDNALCESFFATLECELLDRERFRTPAAARRAVFDYIEGWYNPRRRHSALGYESPLRYERLHAARARRGPAPERSRAVEPPGATLTQGGAISVSPQTSPITGPARRGRA